MVFSSCFCASLLEFIPVQQPYIQCLYIANPRKWPVGKMKYMRSTRRWRLLVDVERGASSCARISRTRLMAAVKVGALVALAAGAGMAVGWPLAAQLAGVAALGYLAASGAPKWLYIAAVTLPRDTRALCCYIGLMAKVKWCERKNLTLPTIFRQHVAKQPDKPCLVMDHKQLSFQQVEDLSNRCAHVLRAAGVARGDVVALVMSNRPEFVCAWLGVAKLGAVTALVNTNLRRAPLAHSLAVAKSKVVIAGNDLVDAVLEVSSGLPPGTTLLAWDSDGARGEFVAMAPLLRDASAAAPDVAEAVGYHDRLLYIYTSGTTGLPKAAVITTARFVFMVAGIAWLAGFRRGDRLYTPLPLYHTAGGIMSVGQAIVNGNTVVIRERFSASAFFTDCRKHEATVAQYIGEMARYVLATPPSARDREHSVRLMFGNGLRPQIWTRFVERFGVARIAEFYGATEGNANIVNIDNKVGAIGFLSRIIPGVYPISIIRVDPATGEPLRNATGLCTVCQPGEPGVFVGKIVPGNPTRAFLGYVDQAASDKKVVRNVFSRGDSAFLSGDILVSDERGYLFFRDRTGDTFRWKGENVSTSEVEAVLSNLVGYRDVVVYGVQVGQMEGRAGMAAVLDAEGALDVAALAPAVCGSLPAYARPLVLRCLGKMDLTGTFKMKKVDLQAEGFDPAKINDRLFYLTAGCRYEPLTSAVYQDMANGTLRL